MKGATFEHRRDRDETVTIETNRDECVEVLSGEKG